MSIELPEAHILAVQMTQELKGKQIANIELRNYKSLQKIGCINRNLSDYDELKGCKIESVTSRGLVIRIKLSNAQNLLFAPEYGGKILYHPKNGATPEKFHLKLQFADSTALTVTLTGLGGIQAFSDANLSSSYVYRRDFSEVPSPIDSSGFSLEQFSKGLTGKNVNIKSVLVGKDALVVGLSNSAFQDIIFRAKIHPKKKASSLSDLEQRRLFEGVKVLVDERIRAGGKNQFTDFYGKQGTYVPAMGPNMKGQPCKTCGTTVEALSLGGGQVFFCPKCQT